jgi:tRNA uridine 5-carboxymethylaminomethyl modification enzyme
MSIEFAGRTENGIGGQNTKAASLALVLMAILLAVSVGFTVGCAGNVSGSSPIVPHQLSLQFSPASLNFGKVVAGKKTSQNASVTNQGTDTVVISQISSSSNQFAITGLTPVWPELGSVAPEIAEQVEIDARHAGYLERQERDIASFRRDEALLLPEDLDYTAVGSLSREICGKLATARPATLGAAARISGVTPAALVALLKHVKRRAA